MGNIRGKTNLHQQASLMFTVDLWMCSYLRGCTVNIYQFAVQAHMRSKAEVACQTDDLVFARANCNFRKPAARRRNIPKL